MVTPSAPPLRILMTADPVGGVWTFSLDLIEALGSLGVGFALATMGRKLGRRQRDQVSALPNVCLYESDFKLEWMEEPWEDVDNAADWLLDIAADFQPDLVHLNGYAHAALPWQRPVLVAAHSCVYSWFSAVRNRPPPPHDWSVYHQNVRLGLKAASVITAPTAAMRDALHMHYGDTFESARVIHNGRPPELFRPASKEELILTGGRLWDEAKNMEVLDAAAAEVNWPILAAGAENHPDGGRVSFSHLRLLGELSPKLFTRHLARASIYALPARYEPFGLSALEAGLSGCALVLGDIPSLREVWGDAAWFVPPNDPAGWKRAFQGLIDDAPLRAALAERALQRAQKFTASRMADGYLNIYRSMLINHRKKYANRSLLPIAPVRLEPRKRSLSSRLRD